MQRKTFVENLMAIGGFGLLPANTFKHYQRLYLLQCFVAGFRFYEGMSLLQQMQAGDMLELVREPQNEYDGNAIALHWNKKKIGFIPAAENSVLSRLMDAKALELMAEITHLNKEVQPWENVSVAIHFLKELAPSATPDTMQYLTVLETPHYRSFAQSNNVVSRLEWYEDDFENDTDWYGYLVKNSKDDSIYTIIHSSDVLPDYDYGTETGEYLVINKKRLPNDEGLQNMLRQAEQTMGELENLFSEDGYIVVATKEVEASIGRLSSIADVVDKFGRHFIELKF